MSMRDSVKKVTWLLMGVMIAAIITLGVSILPFIGDTLAISAAVVKHITHLIAIAFGGWFLSPFLLNHREVLIKQQVILRENEIILRKNDIIDSRHLVSGYTGVDWLLADAKLRIQIILILNIVYLLWNLPLFFS